ncbi:HTH_Tnp_Tc3_2 domain-containing protein [Trichonephila clavipes]|nr:HTH_Tnp_Tc3_2 domain-containing protein [Trichonephila clavipes]
MNTDKTMVAKGFGGKNFPNLNKGNQVARCESEIGVPNCGPRAMKGWSQSWNIAKIQIVGDTGRPRVTTPNENQYLAVTVKRNRRSTESDLFPQISPATGTTVSRQTVHRRLGHIGLHARRPVRCVPLTATHCRLRLT